MINNPFKMLWDGTSKKIYWMRVGLSEGEAAKNAALMMNLPSVFECRCKQTDRFRIIADDDDKTSLVFFQCSVCRWCSPPFELRKPQMRDEIAIRAGAPVADLDVGAEFLPEIPELSPDEANEFWRNDE